MGNTDLEKKRGQILVSLQRNSTPEGKKRLGGLESYGSSNALRLPYATSASVRKIEHVEMRSSTLDISIKNFHFYTHTLSRRGVSDLGNMVSPILQICTGLTESQSSFRVKDKSKQVDEISSFRI